MEPKNTSLVASTIDPAQNASRPASVSDAVDAFTTGVAPLVDALSPELQTILPKDALRHAKVGPVHRRVIPMLIQVLRSNPTLVGDFTPDDIEAEMADAAACTLLSQQLSNLVTALNDTARLKSERGWHLSSAVYAAGRSRMAGDKVLGEAIEEVRGILAQGPHAETAAHTAVTAEQRAVKARARATEAEQKSEQATAKAAALNPAPTPPAAPTGGSGSHTP